MTVSVNAEILRDATARRRGVGAFNAVLLEQAEAVVAGAEAAGLPVVLQVSENTARYHGAPEPLLTACLALARPAAVPVIVHLDHATSFDLIRRAVAVGVTSVMYDGSALPDDVNRDRTAEVVDWCHGRGVWVEAELGEVGGKDGAHASGARTDPGQAYAFVTATGVDALAVAVGSSHAMDTRTATLDLALVARLRARVPATVPLVLHGSSGVPDDGLRAAVRAGITKVNIATHLNRLLRDQLVAATAGGVPVDPRTWLTPARRRVADEVARLLTVLAA